MIEGIVSAQAYQKEKYLFERLTTLRLLGDLQRRQGRLEESRKNYEKSLRDLLLTFRECFAEIGASMEGLADLLVERGRLQEALETLQQILVIYRENFEERSPETARMRFRIGTLLVAQQRFREALAELRGLPHANLPRGLSLAVHLCLARAHEHEGELAEAAGSQREALRIQESLSVSDENLAKVVALRQELADQLERLEKYPESQAELERVLRD